MGVYFTVDVSDLQSRIQLLQAACKPERYERAMYRIYNRTGKHVRKILKTDLPKKYYIGASKVGKAVKDAQISGMGCNIPVRDKRGDIGGQYSATGSAAGWESLHKKYRVKARIVKGGKSVLPEKMQQYGSMAPFRNIPSKLNTVTFTRTGKSKLPIKKVVGIAIPQMPMNRSMDDVQKDIHDWMAKQVEREFMNLMAGR